MKIQIKPFIAVLAFGIGLQTSGFAMASPVPIAPKNTDAGFVYTEYAPGEKVSVQQFGSVSLEVTTLSHYIDEFEEIETLRYRAYCSLSSVETLYWNVYFEDNNGVWSNTQYSESANAGSGYYFLGDHVNYYSGFGYHYREYITDAWLEE